MRSRTTNKIFGTKPVWFWSLLVAIFIMFLIIRAFSGQQPGITLHYLGHSSFLIDFEGEVAVLTDYGKPNAWKEYGYDSPVFSIGGFLPDIATYSHKHEDHYDPSRLNCEITKVLTGLEDFNYKDLRITAVATSEKEIGKPDNFGYLFEYKGVRIMHMGDCQANIIGIDKKIPRDLFLGIVPDNIDILLFPIEGTEKYPDQAEKFVELTNAKIYIPMHYWTYLYKTEFLESCKSLNDITIKRLHRNEFEYKRTSRKGKILYDLPPDNLY